MVHQHGESAQDVCERVRLRRAQHAWRKARIAFWFVCVMLGVLVAGMRYQDIANLGERAVWEKALEVKLGAAQWGGVGLATLLIFASNLVLGTVFAGAGGVLASRWGGTGVMVMFGAFFVLIIDRGAAAGIPEMAITLLGVAAGAGSVLGLMAWDKQKHMAPKERKYIL